MPGRESAGRAEAGPSGGNRVRRRRRPCRVVGQLGELKRVRRAEAESADVVDRVGSLVSRGSAERPFAGVGPPAVTWVVAASRRRLYDIAALVAP